MRLLANENIPRQLVEALRAGGADVAWARTAAPGFTDAAVLALAAQEGRILLTFDKDFGELARSAKLPPTCGVILLRLPMPPPGEAGGLLAALILARADWAGHFAVIEPDRIRLRPLKLS
ncbi:MAG: DUF5615 family PIN-like protein [Methylacidiphilales bacterium]|nr:DUF5615 family PIN-like protein [Candidatus Methylacidiphilales bacterium]